MALDQDHGPYKGGCKTCRGIVTVTHTSFPSTTAMTVDYVALGHASKFVAPGAYRVDSNTFEQGNLEDVAFRNPDGSIVLLVLNGSNQPVPFNVEWQEKYFSSTLPFGRSHPSPRGEGGAEGAGWGIIATTPHPARFARDPPQAGRDDSRRVSANPTH